MKFERMKRMEEKTRREMRNTDKDCFISDNFPTSLKEYETEKVKRIAELETLFNSAGNDAFELVNRFGKGELKNWSTDALRKELKLQKGIKNKREIGKVNLMYSFNQEYKRLTENRHPNYDKYVNYINMVLSELEKEILDRKKGKLERRFAKEIDKCSAFGDVIRNGGLDDIKNKDLEKLYDDYERRKKRVNLLVESYLKHGGEGQGIFVIPNYNKYLNSSISVLSALDVELIFRNEDILGEF